MVVSVRPTVSAMVSSAEETCDRCSRSVPEPMCMCNPVTATLYKSALRRQSTTSSCQIPCLDCGPPVLVFWLCPCPNPGLIRSVTLAPGTALPNCSIMSGEPQLTWSPSSLTNASASRSNTSAVNTIPCGSKPAASARLTSPTLTASTTTPSPFNRFKMPILEHAF